jgi:aminopeptidase N
VINDKYLFRDKVSTEKMLTFANIISHELSHHWFGNLVTMKWWDDVWLNETFATFISYLCLQKLEGKLKHFSYESAMGSFFRESKKGYHQDQMITTHPIRGPVPNTNVADSVFDGITYNKGAATMKQICYLMSEESFGKGLETYFHKY